MYKPKNIPSSPGIYKMIDEKGNILYVGKAKDLKKRISSYFRKSATHGIRIQKMINQVENVEIIIVNNEEEALILENNLIKEYRPKYNVLLRDDKNFLYIKITNEDYPKIELVRKRINDKAYYIGPKTSGGLVRESLDMLRKVYPFRTCSMDIVCKSCTLGRTEVKLSKIDRKTPCLDYHIGRCNAPCIGEVTPKDYQEMMKGIKDFFHGKFEDIAKKLEEKMYNLSQNKKFEQAANLRDLLRKIQFMREKQIIIGANDRSNMDVVGLSQKGNLVLIKLFNFRDGKMIGDESIFLNALEDESKEEIIEKFIYQYYTQVDDVPSEIIIPVDLIRNPLNITSTFPKLGRKKELLELANKNAFLSLEKEKARFEKEKEEVGENILKDIQQLLLLKNEPKRIECFDISHLGGTHTYASMVVFENGLPKTKDYRRFKINSLPENKIDDFASMQEALSRRLLYIKNIKKIKNKIDKTDSFSSIPDLILIDGGKGQLNSAIKSRNNLKLKIPMISLAKQEEEIFIEKSKISIKLNKSDEKLKLLQRIRDEAHRFAITANKNARIKDAKTSKLDEIKGIGGGTKKKLLKKFGSISGIKKASEKELIETIGTQKTFLLREYL